MNNAFSLSPSNYQNGQSLTSIIWGNRPEPVTQDFLNYGVAASQFPGENAYGIGDAAGSYHTGIDIGTPVGTTLSSPVAGTVVCAGTGNGPGDNTSSCSVYDCSVGNCGAGEGRLEIQFGPGEYLLLGHVEKSLVSVGQTVQPGTPVALSGGAGTGAHVHVEERIPASLLGISTSSGEAIVNPANIIGGQVTGSVVGGGLLPNSQGFDAAGALQAILPQVSNATKRTGIGLLALGLLVVGGAMIVLDVKPWRFVS